MLLLGGKVAARHFSGKVGYGFSFRVEQDSSQPGKVAFQASISEDVEGPSDGPCDFQRRSGQGLMQEVGESFAQLWSQMGRTTGSFGPLPEYTDGLARPSPEEEGAIPMKSASQGLSFRRL